MCGWKNEPPPLEIAKPGQNASHANVGGFLLPWCIRFIFFKNDVTQFIYSNVFLTFFLFHYNRLENCFTCWGSLP